MPNNQMIRGLLLATRPKTLAAGICPVLIGTALAQSVGKFHLISAIACMVGSIFIQIGTNFANDYFDFIKGTDTEERIGPTRSTQAGWVTPRQMFIAFVLAFAIAGGCTVYLTMRAGWPMLAILALSIVCGIAYTAGPFPLGYNGLGDLFAFIFFGPVACAGTWYVQTLEFDVNAILAGIAPGCFAVAMIDVNNTRDMDQDRTAGKRTMAVLFGRRFACTEYILSLLGAAVIPFVLYSRGIGSPWQFTSLAFLPLGVIGATKIIRHKDGPTLNRVLALTGGMLLIHSVLFSVGLIL